MTKQYNPDACCGADCWAHELYPDKPCWGDVEVVDEEYDGDDYWWIHECEGHRGTRDGENINMAEYIPDAWVIVRFSSPKQETIYKVLAGWYGGYCGSDSWKLSSGIERVEVDGDVFHIHNYSGSEYICHKDIERTTGLTGSMLIGWQERAETHPDGISVEMVDLADFMAIQPKDVPVQTPAADTFTATQQ